MSGAGGAPIPPRGNSGSMAGAGFPLWDSIGPAGLEPSTSERLFTSFGRLLGPLIVGYLFFNKSFAYIHIPGTPAYVGEIVLSVGLLAALASLGQLRPLGQDSEMVFVVLAVFCAWGLVLLVADVGIYEIDAVRDSALCYYSLFAFLTYATLARTPGLLDRWARKFARIVPWLVAWLPINLALGILLHGGPPIPGMGVRLFVTKPGDMAISAMAALGFMWLFPATYTPPRRAVWSIIALGEIGVAGTQNRGGMLAAAAGLAVGLVYYKDRRRLLKQASLVIVAASVLASLAPAVSGVGGRAFSPAQLLENIASIGNPDAATKLEGTEDFRKDLWTRILTKQVNDHAIITGLGFGPNLPAEVGVYSAGTGGFRSPHNSHLDVFARMGAIGLVLWLALWLGWYLRLIMGCRRLAGQGLHRRRQVCIFAMMVTTALLVDSFFDPGLEGAQLAALLWTTCGVGVAVTSSRDCFNRFAPPDQPAHQNQRSVSDRRS